MLPDVDEDGQREKDGSLYVTVCSVSIGLM